VFFAAPPSKVAIGDVKKVVGRKHPREKQYRRKK